LCKKYALLLATLRAYWPQFAAAFVPRLLWTAFKFAQPFLINTTINWVDAGHSQRSKKSGYGLIAAYGLVYVGQGLSQALYWQHTYRFIVMVRGGLISIIFQKTTTINPTDKMRHDPIVLMGTDIEKIALSLRQVHEVLGIDHPHSHSAMASGETNGFGIRCPCSPDSWFVFICLCSISHQADLYI
jgi:ATP-binding cassette subfamily C (CFTR/MRP) protein 1